MMTHVCLENRPQDSRVRISKDDVVQTLDARMGMGGGNVPLLMSIESHPQDSRYEIKDPEISQTLSSNMCHDSSNGGLLMETQNSIVRRLTPTECSLLQGFPPDWCDIGDWVDSKGKVHKDSDSPKYKALGNSICLPFWSWMAGRMVEHLKADGVENPKMASLFDGISGFPLVYIRHGCTPVWTSEIEEYPIAVCKKHFGDEQTGEVGDLEKYLHQTTPCNHNSVNGTVYGLDRASFNQGQNALYDFSVEEDKAQTLVARGPGGVCQTGDNADVVGPLCASDCKGIRDESIDSDKAIVQ